jgi:ribonuclease HI
MRIKRKPIVEIATDGSCFPNPGPGGWGAVLVFPKTGARKEIKGGQLETTNNRMEMQAVIEALSALSRPCYVRLMVDSQYVMHGFSKQWVYRWRRNGWITSTGKAVANMDLWLNLIEVVKPHDLKWIWVKGHAGHPLNERADALAYAGRLSIS